MFEVENRFRGMNVTRTVRFTDELFNELNETAKKNDVSFNVLILQCCKYAMDNMKGKETKSSTKPPQG